MAAHRPVVAARQHAEVGACLERLREQREVGQMLDLSVLSGCMQGRGAATPAKPLVTHHLDGTQRRRESISSRVSTTSLGAGADVVREGEHRSAGSVASARSSSSGRTKTCLRDARRIGTPNR